MGSIIQSQLRQAAVEKRRAMGAAVSPHFGNGPQFQAEDSKIEYGLNFSIYDNQQLQRNQEVSLFSDADFEWRGLSLWNGTAYGVSPVTYSMRFTDSDGFYLSNDLVPISMLGVLTSLSAYGFAPLPFLLYPGLIIPAGGKIGVETVASATQANALPLQILFRGVRRYRYNPPAPKGGVWEMPFWYFFNLPSLAAGASANDYGLQMDFDADFSCRAIQFLITSGGLASFSYRIAEMQDRYTSNSLSPTNLLYSYPPGTGQGSNPRRFYPEFFVPAGGQLIVDVTNTGTGPGVLSFLLMGSKRYYLGGSK